MFSLTSPTSIQGSTSPKPSIKRCKSVLWSGDVLDPKDENGKAIVAFNEHVQNDDRVTNVILTVRDGISLIRRR